MPSPRPGEGHEGVLESHDGLSPSQKQEEGLSRAGRDGNDSCRVLSQKGAMGKPSRANGDTALSQEAKRRLS